MTIQRMDHVGVVVDDLEAAIAFFVELGMELEGEAPIEDSYRLCEDSYRLCYVRGPEGIIVALAEQLS
jgi:Glyoxalase/Bleomycin resistance protein/Dioxygenase superfamily